MKPIVSVIVPVYNVENYLKECIESIINQSLNDIEIIFIDDGSTDNSFKILQEYKEKDSRIQVLQQKNQGAGAARNAGLQIARGKYLSFLDSDDFFDIDMLAKAVKNIEEFESDICVFDVDLYDNESHKKEPGVWVVKKKFMPKKKVFNYKDCNDYIFSCVHTCAWNKLFRTSFIKQYHLSFQELNNTNDLYFVCMALSLAKKISYVPEALMYYRVNVLTSLSQSKSRSMHPDDAHTAFVLLKEKLLEYNLFEALQRSYDNLCLNVYYYNLKKLKSIDYMMYFYKLYTSWLPELKLENRHKEYYFFSHIYDFQKRIVSFKLISFDIFDTVLARKVAEPRGIFMIMQKILQDDKTNNFPQILKSNFTDIRMQNERFMYQHLCNNDKQDVSIKEIYKFIGKNYDLSNAQILYLIELESKVEKENIVPLIQNIKLIKLLLKSNIKVIFISDMYFPQNWIREFLIKLDTELGDIPIFVSCEYNAKKYSGNLYRKIKGIEHIDYKEWIHYGDNLFSDYEKADELGIQAVLYKKEYNYDYLQKLLYRFGNNISFQKIIGLINNLLRNTSYSSLENLGISLGGPFLFSYVYWVVNEAYKRNIRNLYFVARDGYVLKKIANIIIDYKNYNINTFYLYGSRVAWRDPILKEEKEKVLYATRYLENNMNFSDTFAFVEFAGTGTTQDCLVKLIKPLLLKEEYFKGSFFLYHSRNPECQTSKKYSMLRFNEIFNTCIELLVRAPHGQTLGYDNEGRPLTDTLEGEALVKYGYNDYIHGVELFAKEYIYLAQTNSDIDLFDYTITKFYMHYLKNEVISADIADLLGGIPFILDGVSTSVLEYAPILTPHDVELLRLHRRNMVKTNNVQWSLLRSPSNVQNLIGKKAVKSDESYKLKKELDALKNSRSYRVGRVLTFLPRKVRGGIRCYREHGLKYTVKRTLYHMGLYKW